MLYYSQTGATKAVAEALQKELNADIEQIEITEPYSGDYGQTIDRVAKERAEGIVPQTNSLTYNLDEYDVIFLGYPIWFGTYAPPIAGLLQANNLDGKEIVPFATFGSGGLEVSVDSLRAHLPNATIANGYGVRNARIDAMPAELHRFLALNGYVADDACKPLPDFSPQRPVTEAQSEIFTNATSDYMFPLGTAVTCGQRLTPDGTEYLFVAKSANPEGAEAYSSIYVLAPDSAAPVFTRVVR
ncbi:MAG: hypothetical protein K2N16_05225 [Muribaculaceae bacterium]|nr:hypothetical protein [Muribaculaceae bacterium]